jgi:hypothetical protein
MQPIGMKQHDGGERYKVNGLWALQGKWLLGGK